MVRFIFIFTFFQPSLFGIAQAQSTILSEGEVSLAPAPTSNATKLSFVLSAKQYPVKNNGAPYGIVFLKSNTQESTFLGKTDSLRGSKSPEFLNVFTFDWIEGIMQQLHVEVKGRHIITKDETLGEADIDVDDYVLNNNQDITVNLTEGGELTVHRVKSVSFRLSASMVPKLDSVGLTDSFVKCYWRKGKDGKDVLFYSTNVVTGANPYWNENIEFKYYQPGTEQWWQFKVQDRDVGRDDFVGEALVEVGPFISRRVVMTTPLSAKADNHNATLTITPL